MRISKAGATSAFALFIFFGGLLNDARGENFPFSDKVDWSKEENSKNYEKILKRSGVTKEFYGKTSIEDVATGECFLLKDNKGVVGSGAVFSEFRVSGAAENAKTKDRKKIDIKKAEIVSDKEGRFILLTTHRFRLNAFEEFMAGFRKKKPYGERATYHGPDLGDGYFLDSKTQELVGKLLDAAKKCAPES